MPFGSRSVQGGHALKRGHYLLCGMRRHPGGGNARLGLVLPNHNATLYDMAGPLDFGVAK